MLPDAAVEAFQSRLDESARGRRDEVAAALENTWSAARAAWPAIELDPARFCAFLGERAADAGVLPSLKTADLYLACACLDGDARALRAFQALLDQVGRKLQRLAGDGERLSEAKQIVAQVVMARGDRPAPLHDYSGRGDLGGWLRIALGRELVHLSRRAARSPRLDTAELAAAVDPEDDPETRYLKTHYEQEFKSAFAAAIPRLGDDERRALRYAIVERLGIDDIARLNGVHRATAARQVARARELLVEETRRVLQERLSIEPTQLESILRLVSSQVDVSVRRLLTD